MFITDEVRQSIYDLCVALEREAQLLYETLALCEKGDESEKLELQRGLQSRMKYAANELQDEEVVAKGQAWLDLVVHRALERELHIAIELIADIGNALIDALIMRDPGGYVDIVDILQDESVIDERIAHPIRTVVSMRRTLTQEYRFKNDASVVQTAQTWQSIGEFVTAIRDYLKRC